MVVDNVLQEFEVLKDKPLDQFIHLSYCLKNEPGKLFNSKLISTDPLDIKLRINLGHMVSTLDECTMSLVKEGTAYIVDKQNTLYVQIDNPSTLQIMIDVLYKFVLKTFEVETADDELTRETKQTGSHGIPLAS